MWLLLQEEQWYQACFIFMQILGPLRAKIFCIQFILKGIFTFHALLPFTFLFWFPSVMGLDHLIIEVWRSHSDTPHSVGLPWTSVRLVADTSTWQHTRLKRERHLCSRWDSNPQSQQRERLLTYTIDRAVTGIGLPFYISPGYLPL